MSRNTSLVLAALLVGSFTAGSVSMQSAAAAGERNQKLRAAHAHQLKRNLPACKAKANRLQISYTERVDYMKKCLRP